ncbi:Uncharacterized protein TPAR_07216 [Tolypocladium paradoxum]|uniref:Uncharacterized protein n=1 Tax=Tolypocladium paradoxum TaxID=94208 RepID=A0A2S4KQY3_9HYPO|nr:Uncharacterized protein TPAR_07216 [Tolypocladium paradoxum]
MLTTAPAPSPRARLLVVAQRSSRHSAIALTGASLLRSRHHLQSRGFRFGPWWCHADPDQHREARRRHRALRYRYMESLNRKLSWENSPLEDSAKGAIMGAMARFTQTLRSPARGKYVNVDDAKTWSDDLSGRRPGRNIEDVEREAIDHLFSTRRASGKPSDPWTPLQNIRKYLETRRSHAEATPETVLHATTSAGEQDRGFIDPITNRRMATPSSGDGASASATRKSEDVDHDASKTSEVGKGPKQQDLPKYSTTLDNPNAPRKLTAEEKSKEYKDLGKYRPVQWNEPDALRKTTPEEDADSHEDLRKCSSVVMNDPNAQQPPSPEEKPKIYSDLDKYKPVSWNEPDGLREQTPEERSKNYDDLDKYGAVRWNEPDGLRELTPEELSKNYDDLDKYGPVAWNEPDGLGRLTPEEESKHYKDLGTHKEGFVANGAVLQAHEEKQQDPTQKSEPIPAKVEVPSEDPTKPYDDLDKYGPVRWNEPDGLRRLTPEELSKNYEDLPKYRQYDNSGPATPRVHPEETSKQYEDLRKYDSFPNAGPTTERIHPDVHPEEPTKNDSDLGKDKPRGLDSPSRTCPMHPEEATEFYKDFTMHNESHGKGPVSNGLDAYDSGVKAPGGLAASSTTHRSQPSGSGSDSFDDASQNDALDSRTAGEIRAAVLRRARDSSQKAKLQKAKSQHELNWDATSKDAQDTIGQLKRKTGQMLTGNYTRDFPEESATSWSTSNSPSKTTLYPKNREDGQVGAVGFNAQSSGQDAELSSMDESFPSEETKLEPSLNRRSERRLARGAMSHLEKKQAEADPYSKAPQGLQTSYAEECGGRATWPTLVKHYKSKTPKEAEVGSMAQAEGDQQPASYKVLAYDPSTQSISVAETTSGVHETTSPASPAAVLLRLSNPSKFLPHFTALQAQGYEIVSGGGDVLVFRKVRPGSPEATSATGVGRGKGSPINPIDMMGKPVTGNFASPTGFVNYDALAEGEGLKPSPPYPNGAREEGYSGEGSRKGKKKKSFGRKVVVGTVWVAGIAYSVGVLGEYFATGGMDGLGPKRP